MAGSDRLGKLKQNLFDVSNRARLDRLFVQVALARGYAASEEIEACVREQESLGKSGQEALLGQLLVKRGYLTSGDFLEVLRLQDLASQPCPHCGQGREVSLHPAGVRLLCLGCGREEEAQDPVKRLGKYTLLREIARGGVGIVYEAEDPNLKRRVALKVLLKEDADEQTVARLHREATLAAQLHHPNIVGIHEVGTAISPDGRPVHFITMDFVQGKTLADLLADAHRDRADILRIMEDVARAVAFAHSKGVIHRDLKPANVLVQEGGRVLLTDFGLARATESVTRLTQTGNIMGTPQYMAPEQIQGRPEILDARTDVYALGVMLYEVAAGNPPFDGDSVPNLFRQILQDDPPSLRGPGKAIAHDLEVITLKAMDKSPERRYPTAAEFAEDLARYRRGEPIAARPPSLIHRIWKRVTQHRTPAAALAAGLLVAAVLAVVLLAQKKSHRDEALKQLRKRSETSLEAALEFRRAGRNEQMKKFAGETEAACEEAMREFPDLAEPHYRLGRMARALMQDERALDDQERALSKDPRYAPSLYERVVLTSRLYRRRVDAEVERAGKEGGDGLGLVSVLLFPSGVKSRLASWEYVAMTDPEAQRLRKQIESDLRQLVAAIDLGESSVSPGEVDCARGLLAWVTGDVEPARRLLLSAVTRTPTLEEGYEALATLEIEQGRYETSIEWWIRGQDHDLGYTPFLEGRAFARLLLGLQRSNRGEDAATAYRGMIEDYDKAFEKRSDRSDLRMRRAIGQVVWASYRTDRGEDAAPQCEAAVRDLDEVVRLDAAGSRALMWRGVAYGIWAQHRRLQGDDPEDRLQPALRDLEEALRRNPQSVEIVMWRGLNHSVRGWYLFATGKDVTAACEAAIADFDEALRRNPEESRALLWRGVARELLAGYRALQLKPAKPLYEAGIADISKVLEAEPDNHDARMWLGIAQATWNFSLALWGGDAKTLYREGMVQLDEVVRRNPGRDDRWAWRGRARMTWGDLFGKRGDLSYLEGALSDFDEAIRLNSGRRDTWVLRCEVRVKVGRYQRDPKVDLAPLFEKAIADAEVALGLDPSRDDARLWRGAARGLLAKFKADRGENTAALFRTAIEDFTAVIEKGLAPPTAWHFRGESYETLGAWMASRGESAKVEYQAALDDYTKAISLNGLLAFPLQGAVQNCRDYLKNH